MWRTIFIVVLFVIPLYASMNDGQALSKVRKAYGLNAGLASNRFGLDSNWTRMIQLKTPMCNADNGDLGIGFNTWEAAFMNMTARVASGALLIKGPFKGTVDLATNYPVVGTPTSMALYIDGNVVTTIGQDFSAPPYVKITYTVDTTQLGFGLHAACLVSSDALGVTTNREPSVFMVDQTTP